MHEFNFIWIQLGNVNTTFTKTIDLFKKLSEITPPLVIDKSLCYKSHAEALTYHSYAEFNIFRPASYLKPSGLFPHASRNAHLETSGVKLANMHLTSANSSGRKHARHGITYGFLNWSK